MIAPPEPAVRMRSIIMQGESVIATIKKQKTQTRRVIRLPNIGIEKIVLVDDPWHQDAFEGTPAAGMGRTGPREKLWYCEDWCGNLILEIGRCPYGKPGDRLWVREKFRLATGRHGDRRVAVQYAADSAIAALDAPKPHRGLAKSFGPWRSPLLMPQWASRLTLEIVNVRAERLWAISAADAVREGMEPTCDPAPYVKSAIDQFKAGWDAINAARGYGWKTDPFVWVIEYRIVTP